MVNIAVKRLLKLVMKRNQTHRSLYKTCKRMAKINLTKLFNKCVVKPYKHRQEKKFKNVYREKIKTEYLFQDANRKHGGGDNLVNRVKFIEFNDMNYPSLREQILKSSKVYVKIPPEVNVNHRLVKSTSDYKIIKMSSGLYLNFGVEKSLQTYLKSHPNLHFNNSCLDLSIGLYVIKSVTERGIELPHYLIVLGKIANILHQTAPNNATNTSFIIAIYDGSFPTPVIANEILRPFVDEMKELITKSPIEQPFNGRKISRIGLHSFICDPIANSIFTCTSLPDSLYGCSKCRVKSELRVNGQFNSNITSFPVSCKMDNLRLDEDFKYCLDSDYHLDVPIVMELNVGLVSQTSIDYKHTVCAGVMKQLVTLWTKGKLDYRINRNNWLRMLRHLEKISENCPDELQKPFNYSDDTDTWDAYHWKLFLIYFGPIVLHSNLPRKYYINFLYLHLASRIMINQYKSRKHSALIVGLFLNRFIADFAELYGEDHVDYNVHNLIHFEDTISQLGSIESVGGFSYEEQFNFVHSLIQYNRNIPIEEIAEQILYKNNCSITSMARLSFTDKPYHIDADSNLIFDNFVFDTKPPNNYILSKKGIFEINEIISNCNEQIFIVGRKFHSISILYQAPLNEEKLVSVCKSDYVEIITLDEIITKLIKFETNSGWFMMPLIRTS